MVAHELGHQQHHDLLRGLAWLAIVAPAGTFLVQALAERFARRDGPAARHARPALPAIALAVALVSFGLGCASNALSRQVEASADSFSLELTRDPAAFIAARAQLALRNSPTPIRPRCSNCCSAPIRRRSSGSARRGVRGHE